MNQGCVVAQTAPSEAVEPGSGVIGVSIWVAPSPAKMIDDQDLGFLANFLGICIFVLVVAYHYVVADPKFDTQGS
ncbi:hypothetical protein R1flu_027352 [Riccia fluitans]|uniref:Dolichyl-diphosphooligosaccharide--protein glycosyltransferase subunit 4A n=1 Tax=Riccia fluitans TaxID=41844 RepID=A0ABD1XIK9_9MARC